MYRTWDFQPATSLLPGDLLLSDDGQWVTVDEVYDTGEYEAVYNLRVADFHTYFVGDDGWGFSVWAHNAICALSGADEAASADGQAFATRAKDLYRGLSSGEKASSTIAVSKVMIDGQWVEVVAMNGGAMPSGVSKVRAAVESGGGIFYASAG